MKPIRVPETQKTLGAPQGMENEVDGLPVHYQKVGDYHTITSVWMLSEEDLMLIKNGGNVRLGILGGFHPPVMLWVE
jgi:hypothetical protein